MVLFAGLSLTRTFVSSASPFDKKDYQQVDKEFQERTAALKRKERTILARYRGKSSTKAALNNGTQDTVKKEKADKVNSQQKPLINVNTAGLKELQKLPGIGPAYARRIIQYRKKSGAFKTSGDLLKIKGIGPATFEKMKPFISLKGGAGKTDSLAASHSQVQKVKETSEKKASTDHSRININTADAQKLQALPGIGPAYSKRIVAFRQKNGPFKTKSALLKIKGIGKKTLAKIKPFIKLRE
jgi:comEA protein